MPRSLQAIVGIASVIIILVGSIAAVVMVDAGPDWLRFWEDDDYEYNVGFYDPPREAFEMTNAVDQHGDPIAFEKFEGKSVFVYFGYTNCPDYCPATVAEWREVKAVLGDDADDVVFLMVTVDPERDTPERLNEWLNFWDPEFYGAVMSPEDTEKLTSEWGITVTRRDAGSESGYLVDHDIATYVIGPDGQVHLTYPLGFEPEAIAEDIRHLNNQD